MQIRYHRGHISNVANDEQRRPYQAKTLCNLYRWLEEQQGALHSFSNSLTKICLALEQS